MNDAAVAYYKATRPDGTDFNTGTIDYAAALGTGVPVTHPGAGTSLTDASDYLSVSTSPSDCTGFRWPCRLFIVEPVDPWTPHANRLPNKRACRSLLVIEERPPHEVFGPNGGAVVAVIERASRMTLDEVERLGAAWGAVAHCVRDLITPEQFELLAGPWNTVIGASA